ncbi:MAG TPA: PfkB family carbohydrate kinase [Caulobacteraceae bacterium]|jgi:pyridoxine kinase
MPLALILSSFVSASRVGGMPQALALSAFKVDPVLVPTVLFGRRPGEGVPPGGGPVAAETFRGVLEGVESHGLFGLTDLAITGYFALPAQVEIAAEAIARAKRASREGAYGSKLTVVVDPIMGDDPEGLYVSEAVARCIAALLVPLADVLTPNLWELGRLTGVRLSEPEEVAEAARALGKPVLVTSVPMGERIGAVYAGPKAAVSFAHRRVENAPHGTGDVVAAVLGAHLIEGVAPAAAAEQAIRAAAETVFAAEQWDAPELPVVALGERLRTPTAEVSVRRLG